MIESDISLLSFVKCLSKDISCWDPRALCA
jgi:hypothetical protein